jgi:hypothetical protein
MAAIQTLRNKKGGNDPPFLPLIYLCINSFSAQKQVVVPCPVGKYGGIEHLSATGAFPGIE